MILTYKARFLSFISCTFHSVGTAAGEQKFNSICILSLNIINEKVLFVLFVIVFVLFVTAFGMLHSPLEHHQREGIICFICICFCIICICILSLNIINEKVNISTLRRCSYFSGFGSSFSASPLLFISFSVSS